MKKNRKSLEELEKSNLINELADKKMKDIKGGGAESSKCNSESSKCNSEKLSSKCNSEKVAGKCKGE